MSPPPNPLLGLALAVMLLPVLFAAGVVRALLPRKEVMPRDATTGDKSGATRAARPKLRIIRSTRSTSR